MIRDSSRSAFSSRASISPTTVPPAPNCRPMVMTGMRDQSTSPGRLVEPGKFGNGTVAAPDQDGGHRIRASIGRIEEGESEVAASRLDDDCNANGGTLVVPQRRPGSPVLDGQDEWVARLRIVEKDERIVTTEAEDHRGTDGGHLGPIGHPPDTDYGGIPWSRVGFQSGGILGDVSAVATREYVRQQVGLVS